MSNISEVVTKIAISCKIIFFDFMYLFLGDNRFDSYQFFNLFRIK